MAAKLNTILSPECRYTVEVTGTDEILCRAPGKAEERIGMSEVRAVYVEINDTGPWGADVWWLIEGKTGENRVVFPPRCDW